MTGQSFIQIAPDSTGKKADTWIVLGSGGAEVHREAFILAFPDTSIGSVTATSFGGFTALHVSPIVSSGVSALQAGTWSVGTGDIRATQLGTWTVQQGGAPWSVTFPSAQQVTFTNSVGTHPVTIEGQPISVSQNGTWNINTLTAITSSTGVSATIVGQPISVSQSGAPWSVTNATSVGTHNVVSQSSLGRALEFAIIQQSAVGSTAIVAADASNRIKVVSYALVSQPDNYLHWRSATTPISGPMVMAASSGVSFVGSYPSIGMQTAVNEALNLFATATGSVGGHVAFYREP